MKIDTCVIHLIPPKVKIVNENKFNFLLIGNIMQFKATDITVHPQAGFCSSE